MKKILVVDDSETNLTLISGLLGGLYRVYLVNSGANALELTRYTASGLDLV